MKRVLAIYLILVLTLTSCANLHEEETLEEEYTPEVDVTDYAVYSSGASIILDWETVRKKALIKYEKFCAPDEIEFDLNMPSDNRYIDYDLLGSVETEVSGGDFADAARPNGNFLTDGVTRKKLCPDRNCRENEDQSCTHINLVGGYVWGNYVYYIGKYKAEEQKSGQWNAEYENYLMRYSIPDQEEEVVARLPWFCYIAEAAYGVLYIAYIEDVPFNLTRYNPHTLLYDCENVRLAHIPGFNTLFLAEGDGGNAALANNSFYYLNGKSFWRCDYDLAEQEKIGEADFGETKFGQAKLLGYAKSRLFYTVYDYMTDSAAVRSLKEDGRSREVIASCTDAALITDGLSAYLYTIEGKEIAMYTLNRLGLGEERTVIFTEAGNLDFNEHLQSMETIHNVLYFTTKVGQYTNHTRTYLFTEHGAVLDNESGAPEKYADEEAASPVPGAP